MRDELERLRAFVLDPYDLALSKLTRSLAVDVEDVLHLARSSELDPALLEARNRDESGPYVSCPVERHDLTLGLWLEAMAEYRSSKKAG